MSASAAPIASGVFSVGSPLSLRKEPPNPARRLAKVETRIMGAFCAITAAP